MKKIIDLNYKGGFFGLLWLLSIFGCIGWIVGAITEKKLYFILFVLFIIIANVIFYFQCKKYDKKIEESKKNENVKKG